MLLSSLLSGFLLATSVISTPASSASSQAELVASGHIEFEVAQKAVIQVQQSVKNLCRQGYKDEVKRKLDSIYQPIFEVAVKIHEIVQIKETIVLNNVETYFIAFVKLLVEFEIIIKTVVDYPHIVKNSKSHFSQFNTHFEVISKDLHACGINVDKRLHEHPELHFTIWATVGITFQSNYLESH
ncbi:hypothetical protein O181_080007 [Austropuccinia psidii MF-1]|uniref:Uncharacterized protein n=1 Tax=Austropuccinia psidii MF-1 TaxID=1389203 RepID=A0A9Q3FKU3_9BASI|nr:hypothetical protein [Austropuccinia psidii MF-1]